MDFIKELKWRGMIHDIMPETEYHLNKEKTSGYIGFDPTSDSLHIGSLVQILILRHFQMCGHKPIFLIGGATGMIGDPSGKSSERNLLSQTKLKHNIKAIKKQLSKFLDFNSKEPNAAIICDNSNWFDKIKDKQEIVHSKKWAQHDQYSNGKAIRIYPEAYNQYEKLVGIYQTDFFNNIANNFYEGN